VVLGGEAERDCKRGGQGDCGDDVCRESGFHFGSFGFVEAKMLSRLSVFGAGEREMKVDFLGEKSWTLADFTMDEDGRLRTRLPRGKVNRWRCVLLNARRGTSFRLERIPFCVTRTL
jgi:hypothetical protein